ncbi:hypothetical protein FS842_000248 [Serendipita sp. 407]|nr:hypothetical protein FS842_000248 [Serendipita sp. 407]
MSSRPHLLFPFLATHLVLTLLSVLACLLIFRIAMRPRTRQAAAAVASGPADQPSQLPAPKSKKPPQQLPVHPHTEATVSPEPAPHRGLTRTKSSRDLQPRPGLPSQQLPVHPRTEATVSPEPAPRRGLTRTKSSLDLRPQLGLPKQPPLRDIIDSDEEEIDPTHPGWDEKGNASDFQNSGDDCVPLSEEDEEEGKWEISHSWIGPEKETVRAIPIRQPGSIGISTQVGRLISALHERRASAPANIPSSPIVASQSRAQKRRRVEFMDDDNVEEQQIMQKDAGHDVLSEFQNRPSMRKLPNPQRLAEFATQMDTPFRHIDLDDDLRKRRSQGIPKPHQLSFYTPHSKMLLRIGKEHYRTSIICKDAFPSGEERAQWGKAAWDYALSTEPSVAKVASLKVFNTQILRLIGDTAWCCRGAVKTEAKRLVAPHYQLAPPSLNVNAGQAARAQAIKDTRDRVAYLLEDFRYLYGEFQGRNDIPFTDLSLPLVIESSIFNGLSLESREILNPMPASLVALAATAIYNALEEWQAGYFIQKPLKEETHGSMYRMFCKKLANLKSARPNRFLLLMTSIYGFCLHQARTQEEGVAHIDSDDDQWKVFGPDSKDDEPLN